jgi:hypothetical protein
MSSIFNKRGKAIQYLLLPNKELVVLFIEDDR